MNKIWGPSVFPQVSQCQKNKVRFYEPYIINPYFSRYWLRGSVGKQDPGSKLLYLHEILMPSDRAPFETYVCQFLAKVTLQFFYELLQIYSKEKDFEYFFGKKINYLFGHIMHLIYVEFSVISPLRQTRPQSSRSNFGTGDFDGIQQSTF